MSAIPTASSPNAISGANHVYASLLSSVSMNVRYQSYVIAGLPSSGIATALVQ